ncbi:MAG: BrnT family toxin [Candidatus Humimicrobiaceae bacterium]
MKHSQEEDRYYVLGKTDAGRFLFIVFTIRKSNIRIISARVMNKKERQVYLNYEKDS